MDLFKTIAAVGGVALSVISGIWTVGVTFGRSEVKIQEARLDAFKSETALVHTNQNERLENMREAVQRADQNSQDAAKESKATRELLESHFGVRKAGGR